MATQKVGGQTVAILGFAPYPWADPLLDIAAAKRRVQAAARTAQVVVVTFHGGAEGSDKTHVPPGSESAFGENRGNLRAFTHAMIDAGADVLIGHGPHVRARHGDLQEAPDRLQPRATSSATRCSGSAARSPRAWSCR